jgi:Leucine-rich repeat (LRR) protein
LERAQKLGILSLSEHGLTTIPNEIFEANLAPALKTLDLSKNQLNARQILQQEQQHLLLTLVNLKTLNLDYNSPSKGTSKSGHGGKGGSGHRCSPKSTAAAHSTPPADWRNWNTLQNLSLAGNHLGQQPDQSLGSSSSPAATTPAINSSHQQDSILPILPPSLKSLNLASNQFTRVPGTLLLLRQCELPLLQVLNLSDNQLTVLPDEMFVVMPLLQELRLDDNRLTCIPQSMGQTLKQLKILSLRNNQLQMLPTTSTTTASKQMPAAPLPASLFTDTALVDLNLHGNAKLSHTLLSSFDGYDVFCERRRLVKQKTMSNMDNCGLD